MLGFASEKALYELSVQVANLELRFHALETDWKAQIAALENAAQLYNRAAARVERSKPGGAESVGAGARSLEEIRRRRGGV